MKKIKDTLGRFLGFIGLTVLCFGPLEGYLLANFVFEPKGFWQNFLLVGVAVYIGGTMQFVLFLIWILLVCYLWSPKRRYHRRRYAT